VRIGLCACVGACVRIGLCACERAWGAVSGARVVPVCVGVYTFVVDVSSPTLSCCDDSSRHPGQVEVVRHADSLVVLCVSVCARLATLAVFSPPHRSD